jgi:hypothetical protein
MQMKRIKTKHFEAAGFGGEKVECSCSIAIWVTPEFKRQVRILAANSGKNGYSVGQYLRLLLAEKIEESDEV